MDNLRTCLAFFSAFEDGDVDGMMSLCDDDATVEFEPLGEAFEGSTQGIGRIIWTAFVESFPDLLVELKDIIWSKGGEEAQCLVDFKGTLLYPFIDFENTGHALSIDLKFTLQFNRQAKIVHIIVLWNHTEFKQQLQQS